MPRVPAHLRERALGMLQGGMRTADVARAINCHVRTVRRLRQHYRETGRTADHPRSGRPRVTTPAQDRYIRISHLSDRSLPDITSNNAAYGHKPTFAGPDRSGKKCSSLMSHGFVSPGEMDGFVFIVEGMSVTPRPVPWSGIDLEVGGPSWSGAVYHITIGLSLLSLQAISMPCGTGKTSSSLMWYPCMHAHPDMILQQDNATSHTARSVREFLHDSNVNVLPWPAKSPDLNPIEHVWDLLDRRVRARAIPPRNVQELAGALVEEWGNISQQELTNLVQSMRRRCTAVLQAAGGHTRY
ncbi:hypothetical protein QQF64_003752 [Cirrhinus molitorella]|uniref:Tc1-like transposase DDE domain-containing protein n=1 Tax=Cirrhinus molitorella TaxID=172907 RepID=A0ABR3MM82_9TELE